MSDVSVGISHKRISPEVLRECIPNIDGRSRRRRKVSSHEFLTTCSQFVVGLLAQPGSLLPPFLRLRQRGNFRNRTSVVRNILQHHRHSQNRTVENISSGQDHMPQVLCVLRHEAFPPFIEAGPKLSGSTRRLEATCHRMKAEIESPHQDRRMIRKTRRRDRTLVSAVSRVDPVVQTQTEIRNSRLAGNLVVEARIPAFPQIGLVVAIQVLKIQDVGCRRDKKPPLPRQHAGDVAKVTREDG